MKNSEPLACTGASFAAIGLDLIPSETVDAQVDVITSIASTAAQLNELLTTAISLLTLAWWIMIWVRGEKKKEP